MAKTEPNSMNLVVQMKPEGADGLLAGHSEDPELAALLQASRERGFVFRPMHPGIDDPNLRAYFEVNLPGQTNPRAFAEFLQQFSPVLAAYPKPQDRGPGRSDEYP